MPTLVALLRTWGQRESRRPVRPVSGTAGEQRCCQPHQPERRSSSSLRLAPCQRHVAILCRAVITSHLPPLSGPLDARANPGTSVADCCFVSFFSLSISLSLYVSSTSKYNFIQTEARSVRCPVTHHHPFTGATEQQQPRAAECLRAGTDRMKRVRNPVFPLRPLPSSPLPSRPSTTPTNGEAGGRRVGGSHNVSLVWDADLSVTQRRGKHRSTEG